MTPGEQRFVVAALGARRHYAIPRMLQEAGMLERLYTDICAVKGWPSLLRAVPEVLRPAGLRGLAGRIPTGVPAGHITTFDSFGLDYARRLRQARSKKETEAVFLWAAQGFTRRVLARGFGDASGVYTFNGAGLELLRAARAQGLRPVMEQTIAPRRVARQLLAAERELHPDWAPERAPSSSSDALAEREEAEWQAAELILCGSGFVRDAIAASGGPAERCVVVPYGIDPSGFIVDRPPRSGPLRVLTAGAVGLRKGSPYVLEAARRLKGRAVFRMVGPVDAPPAARRALHSALELQGTIARTEIPQQLAWADVFLLPSICEGSATATYEALCAGLPVICTPNTGSVVRHGADGFIVGLRDVDAIVQHIDRLAGDRERLDAMSAAARSRFADIGLPAYRQRLLAALAEAPAQASAYA